MKMRVPLVACMVMLGWCHAAPADLIVSTDMNLSLAGIQSHRDVTIGEQFDVGIVFTLDGSTSLSSYGFSVRFNTDVLDFLVPTRVETPPPPLSEMDSSNPFVDNAGSDDPILGSVNYGQLTRFDGLIIGNGPVAPQQFRVATMTFKAVASPVAQSETLVLPGMFEPGFEGFFDNDGNDLENVLTFQGGGVSVVPEPSSLVLLGTALSAGFALMLVRRRARRG